MRSWWMYMSFSLPVPFLVLMTLFSSVGQLNRFLDDRSSSARVTTTADSSPYVRSANKTKRKLGQPLHINTTDSMPRDTSDGEEIKLKEQTELVERDHPHKGARDENGRLGYTNDPTKVRRWMLARYHNESNRQDDTSPPPMDWTPRNLSTADTHPCEKLRYSADATRAVLKIQPNHRGPLPNDTFNRSFVPLWTTRTEEMERYNVSEKKVLPTTTKLLCAIYTHAGKHEQVTAAMETWGWRCDGVFAASTQTIADPTQLGYGAINLTHAGEESYGNMWQKTRSLLAYMHDNYMDEYDYFWVGGDDAFLVVENIKQWLAILETRYNTDTEPLYLGHQVPRHSRFRFAGGGPGYVLNRKGLQLYFERASKCRERAVVSAEDRFLGLCLNDIGIKVQDTADARGQQRFVGYDPELMAATQVRGFFANVFATWQRDHPQATMGMGMISEQAFGLHWFKTPELLHHLFALLYRTCPANSVVGAFVKEHDSAFESAKAVV